MRDAASETNVVNQHRVIIGDGVTAAAFAETAVLQAGDRIVAEAGTPWQREQMLPDQAARWVQTRLAYRDTPLVDIVADVNRYHAGGVRLGSADLGALRVTSSFRIDQLETALSGIALSHGLELVRTGDGGFVIRRPGAAE